MARRIQGVTSPGGPSGTGVLPGPRAVQDQVEVLDDTDMVAKDAAAQNPAVESRPLAQKKATTFVGCLFTPGEINNDFKDSFRGLVQMGGLRLGASSDLELVAQTANADTLLIPAIEAVLKHRAALVKAAPHALREVDLDQMATILLRLKNAKEVLEILAPLVYGLTAQVSQLQQYLDSSARTIFRDGVQAEMNRDFLLNRELNPLRLLLTLPAQLAQESKKAADKIAVKVETATLERVKEEQGQGAPLAGPPPAPGPTPPPMVVSPGVQNPAAGPTPKHGKPAARPGKSGGRGPGKAGGQGNQGGPKAKLPKK